MAVAFWNLKMEATTKVNLLAMKLTAEVKFCLI